VRPQLVGDEAMAGGIAVIHHVPPRHVLTVQIMAELHQQDAGLDGES
jgi:hypothetical protein